MSLSGALELGAPTGPRPSPNFPRNLKLGPGSSFYIFLCAFQDECGDDLAAGPAEIEGRVFDLVGRCEFRGEEGG